MKTDIPARRGGREAHSEGTADVPGPDLGGSPETRGVGGLNMVDLGCDTQPKSWGFWVGASGAVAKAAPLCGAEAG